VVPPRPERGGKPAQMVPLKGALRLAAEGCPEDQLHEHRMAKRVRAVLARLDTTPRKLGLKTALLGLPAELVARRAKVPVAVVYHARKVMTRRAQKSLAANLLFKELQP
jgi:DNA-directed RNA polymerase specialized sigma24 family protein